MYCIDQGVLDGGGFFPSRVTAHFVEREGDARPRTTILIKVSEEVVNRCANQLSERERERERDGKMRQHHGVAHAALRNSMHARLIHNASSPTSTSFMISRWHMSHPSHTIYPSFIAMPVLCAFYVRLCVHCLSYNSREARLDGGGR